jgi:hypothetical protein
MRQSATRQKKKEKLSLITTISLPLQQLWHNGIDVAARS